MFGMYKIKKNHLILKLKSWHTNFQPLSFYQWKIKFSAFWVCHLFACPAFSQFFMLIPAGTILSLITIKIYTEKVLKHGKLFLSIPVGFILPTKTDWLNLTEFLGTFFHWTMALMCVRCILPKNISEFTLAESTNLVSSNPMKKEN